MFRTFGIVALEEITSKLCTMSRVKFQVDTRGSISLLHAIRNETLSTRLYVPDLNNEVNFPLYTPII